MSPALDVTILSDDDDVPHADNAITLVAAKASIAFFIQ
ncbi:peptidylprolyl isomerase [Bacillus mycoides]|uniref:Peptidylprolyl isomerase n=1 Tax=Bacillus mycoides TaxID=1405 RepID=C2XQD9_BACMY|nr:peptidylprolyl isomerase [Bacillus mycoides]